MKKIYTSFTIACFIIISLNNVSCTKSSVAASAPKEQLALGHWNINRMQLKIFYNGVFAKDSIVPQVFLPENYVEFGANGTFKYNFNTSIPQTGTYEWTGADDLNCVTSNTTYKWKKLTLIDVLFTVMSTKTDPALPGATIEVYQTFVK